MARLDALIHHLYEFGADTLGIGAGHQVLLVTDGERRPITAGSMREEQVQTLLFEVVPQDKRSEIESGGRASFVYRAPAGNVSIEAMRGPNGLQMVVTRTKEEPPPPVEVASHAEGFEMPRTGEYNLDSPEFSKLRERVDMQPQAAAPSREPPTFQAPTPATAPTGPAATGPAPQPQAAAPAVTPVTPVAAVDDEPGPDELVRPDIPLPIPGQPSPLDPLLRGLVEKGGSDLYVCSGKPVLLRRDGDLVQFGEMQPLSEEQATQLLFSIANAKERREYFDTHDVDFAYEIPGLSRFRANLFADRFGIGGIFRQIPTKILSAETLGIPKTILQLCHLSKGLVLVTGPTGSGKSTTLAAMIDYINSTQQRHIITIEDPIEFVHEDKRCVINQREVGTHTASFKRALRAALREDPDIVLLGELRDLETVAIAIETAETGHLVFGTLHTNTAPSTVDRVIDQFPADQQAQIRTMLSESLKGVVSQVLCKRQGGGRAAALEILIVTTSVANIIREGKTFQLPSIMQTGKSMGMRTMNDALLELVKAKTVAPEDAIAKSIDPKDLKTLFQRNEIRTE